MLIRQQAEIREARELSPLATLAAKSRGRMRFEEECSVRTGFQRDRDRIIHSKSFRRLKHKTQVFISPEGDHYRTRLTHTLEVAQIARTITRALRLNEDLAEAIALGHDLGHTPFGHTGEEALNQLFPGGFHHNDQSLRVVDVLEGDAGLNLTHEVRDGIAHHTGPVRPATLEGEVVRLADRIAYINHDIDDALRANIIAVEDLPLDIIQTLGNSHSQRINIMVTDVINSSRDSCCIKMSPKVGQATERLRDFLFDRIYIGSEAKKEEAKARYLIEQLYAYFVAYPHFLPLEYKKTANGQIERAVCDYIAGMTDRFAKAEFLNCFFPRSFGNGLF
ncbi:MAG: deoxyguanosinetriphosphate triphosphohydrolase [bacterium]